MYINSNYSNYKYLVSASDNFVTLTTHHYINGSSGDSDIIPVIYNYLDTGLVVESTQKFYDSYTLTDISDTFNQDYFSLSLAPLWFLFCCFIIIFIVFLINNLTRIFKKGGVFGSN